MTKRKKNIIIISSIIVATLVVAGIAILIGFHIHYASRWYKGTQIEKVDVSGMTYEESMESIQKMVDSYQLVIKGRDDGSMTVKGSDIDLKVQNETAVQELFEDQHESSVLFSGSSDENKSIQNILAFSEEQLSDLITASELSTGSSNYKLKQPKNAKLVYSEDKKCGVIKNEVLGNVIDPEVLQSALKESIESLSTSIDISDVSVYADVYVKPAIYRDNETLVSMLTTYNQYLLHWIQWDMGNGVTETMGPENIKKFISVNTKKNVVKLKTKKVKNWVEKLCLKYKTMGMTRKFKTHAGKTVRISGGDYGWQIDYDKACNKTLKLLRKQSDSALIAAYVEDASSANQEALTSKVKPVYLRKGYTYDYADKQNDWDTQNYSEVDLTEQKVYVYKNGKLAFECICITGKPVGDRKTRTGVWYVKEKKLEKTLVGADYSVTGKNWVRITWTGTGYHYSIRRDWANWSPTYYKTAGSHGCINLDWKNSQKVYSLIDFNDPVFIHY